MIFNFVNDSINVKRVETFIFVLEKMNNSGTELGEQKWQSFRRCATIRSVQPKRQPRAAGRYQRALAVTISPARLRLNH